MVISTSPSLTDWPACTLIESTVPSTEGETTEDEMGLSWPFASTVVVNVPSVTMSVTGPLLPAGRALMAKVTTTAMSTMAATTPAAMPRRMSFLRRRSARFALSLAYASSSEISVASFARPLCLSACTFVISGRGDIRHSVSFIESTSISICAHRLGWAHRTVSFGTVRLVAAVPRCRNARVALRVDNHA